VVLSAGRHSVPYLMACDLTSAQKPAVLMLSGLLKSRHWTRGCCRGFIVQLTARFVWNWPALAAEGEDASTSFQAGKSMMEHNMLFSERFLQPAVAHDVTH
jgi:hypothetical protein